MATYSEPLLLCLWMPHIQKKKGSSVYISLVLNFSAESTMKDQ